MNPFDLHPEIGIKSKKPKKHLTFKKISSIIENKMNEIRSKQTPRWGYNSRDVTSILKEVMSEMEENCR